MLNYNLNQQMSPVMITHKLLLIGDVHIHTESDNERIYKYLKTLYESPICKGYQVITNGDFYDLWYSNWKNISKNQWVEKIIDLNNKHNVKHIPGNHDRDLLYKNHKLRLRFKHDAILHHMIFIDKIGIGHGHWKDDYNFKYYKIGKWATRQSKWINKYCPDLLHYIKRIIKDNQSLVRNSGVNSNAYNVLNAKCKDFKYGIFAHTHKFEICKKWLNLGTLLNNGAFLIDIEKDFINIRNITIKNNFVIIKSWYKYGI